LSLHSGPSTSAVLSPGVPREASQVGDLQASQAGDPKASQAGVLQASQAGVFQAANHF